MGAPQNPFDDPDSTAGGEFIFGDDTPPPGQRHEVTPDALMARLSALIQTHEGCENVSVIELTRLDPPDSSGCNWSTSVVLEADGVAPELYSLAYAEVIFLARSSLNLK